MHSRFAGLWQNTDFLKLWIGQTVSLFGSYIGGGALRFTAILILGATPLQISLLTAAEMAPTLLIGLLAGVWVDRLRRRPLLIAADLGRALLLLSIPVAYVLGLLRIEQLYLVATLVGTLTIVFNIAYQAFLPTVVRREHLVEGNSKLGMSDSIAEIAGPPMGGTLVQLISAPFAILLDAFSFLGSALAVWGMHVPEPAPVTPAEQQRIRQAVREGMQVILHNPLLRALLGSGVTLGLAGGIIGSLYDLYLIRELGLTPVLVGITIGVGGAGALAGAFVTRAVVARFGIGKAMGGALVLSSASSVLIPLAQGPLAAVVVMLLVAQLADIAYAIYSINEISLRQAVTPDRLLGRVNASFTFVLTLAGLAGTLLGGVLGQALGLRMAIALGVAGGATACLWILLSPLRRLQNAPELVEEATASPPVSPFHA